MKNGTGEGVGVIAQEVQPQMPFMVSEIDDGYLGVQYASLTPYLLEAVKELEAEGRKLKEENRMGHAHQKAEISTLKTRQESEIEQLKKKIEQQQQEITALKTQMAQMDQKIEEKLALILNSLKTELAFSDPW
ncbi:MAG: hypothetical protein HQM13_07130 [SAR324 cluster bacterium]|nr:hypothetical protein [SAR324 cluster bacterium]